MKKILLFLILIFFTTSLYASRDNLYEMFKDYPEIKVFLKDVIDETENPDVKTDVFRDVFEDVIKRRINIKFIPVVKEEDADVIVNSTIKEYTYTKDPLPIRAVPLVMMPFVAIADIVEPKSAAKLVVDYEIRRPEDNKTIFSYKKLTTEARKPQEDMKGEMGYIYGLRENINRFIFRAFYKRGRK